MNTRSRGMGLVFSLVFCRPTTTPPVLGLTVGITTIGDWPLPRVMT